MTEKEREKEREEEEKVRGEELERRVLEEVDGGLTVPGRVVVAPERGV